MTELDIAHAVKETWGARVVYVCAFFHLARWISVRNNSAEVNLPRDIFDEFALGNLPR